MNQMQPKLPHELPVKPNKWRGLYFNGSAYAEVASNTSINFDSSYSILMTLNAFSRLWATSQVLWGKYAVNLTGAVGVLNATDGKLTQVIYRTGAGTAHYGQSTIPNQIAIAAFIYDKPGTKSTLYYNDNTVEQVSMGTMGSNTGANFRIGLALAGGSGFSGVMYNLMYIKEVLTTEQIRNVLLGRISPKRFDVRIWHDYRLGHARDLSGNGNHASIVGARWV